jgi:hypothetical protein
MDAGTIFCEGKNFRKKEKMLPKKFIDKIFFCVFNTAG